MNKSLPYIGRFAPSPTGRLHLGNLMSVALAWADARSNNGTFLLRMEDLDTPRNVRGSADQIRRDLEALGLDWDGPVVYQTERLDLYETALDSLSKMGLVYPCICSRRDIQAAAQLPQAENGPIYPGTCRGVKQTELETRLTPGRSFVFRVHIPKNTQPVTVEDRRLGTWTEDLTQTLGDYVLRRADGIFAYQLACVVDDIHQGITHVVRGEDLKSSCARQQFLYKLLGAPTVSWTHLPLINDEGGSKFSKRERVFNNVPLKGRETLGLLANMLGWTDAGGHLKAHEFLGLFEEHGLPSPTLFQDANRSGLN